MIGKAVSKLIALTVVIAVIISFREAILTDRTVGAAFGGLMSAIPFAKVITDKVCVILKYRYSIPAVSSGSVISEMLKLAVMALIQGPAVAFLMRIFLPLPSGRQTDYEKSGLYSIKSIAFKVITAPIIAVLAAWISQWIFQICQQYFGTALSVIMGLGAVAGTAVASAFWLMKAGLSFGQAIVWRLCVTLGGKMFFTFLTNTLCLVIYVGLAGGMETPVFMAVITLIGVVIIEDIALSLIRQAIVG